MQTRLSPERPQNLQFDFLVGAGVISRFNKETNKVFATSAWAVPSQFERSVPALLSPQTLGTTELETWAKNAQVRRPANQRSEGTRGFDSLMETSLSVGTDVTDIAGDAAVAITEQRKFDLALNFFHPDTYQYSPAIDVFNGSGLPVIQDGATPQTTKSLPDMNLAASTPPSIDLLGWKLQFRAPHVHSLGSCVSQPVNHFHVEVFRARGFGRYDYVMNLHLGTYRNGSQRCFVLWNNYYPTVCWRTCNPTRNDLVQMFKWILAASGAVAGVQILSWVIAAIAEVGASAVFIPLLLLA